MDALKTTPYVTVVQLTDSHLFAGLHDRLMGMQTDHSLEQVIELIATEQAQIDLLMCTGISPRTARSPPINVLRKGWPSRRANALVGR